MLQHTLLHRVTRCWNKSRPKFPQNCPNSSRDSFYWLVMLFIVGQIVVKYLGYVCYENLLPRTFKSSPIWSHFSNVPFVFYTRCTKHFSDVNTYVLYWNYPSLWTLNSATHMAESPTCILLTRTGSFQANCKVYYCNAHEVWVESGK